MGRACVRGGKLIVSLSLSAILYTPKALERAFRFHFISGKYL
jgi:hypothetical protein